MKKTGNALLALFIFGLTLLLFNGLSLIISAAVTVFSLIARGEAGIDTAYSYLMGHLNYYSAVIYTITLSLFALWYYFAVTEPQGPGCFARMKKKNLRLSGFAWIVLLTFALQHVTTLIMTLIHAVAPAAMEEYTQMVEESGLGQYSVMWAIATLILPPLTEEIIFRGLIMRYLRRAGACFVVANLIQAVMFGIFHMNLVQGIYATVLGFILGYLAHRYKTLVMPMFMHLVYNFFGTVLVELENRLMPDAVLTGIVLLSVPLIVLALVMIQSGTRQPAAGTSKEEQI